MVDRNKYLIDLSETLCPLVWESPLSVLSSAEQVMVCVYEVEREVNNGGFDQFFRNAPGQYAVETCRALEAIGATSMAELVRTAIRLTFSTEDVPDDQDARCEILDAGGDSIQEKLSELDARFCEYPDDLTELLFAYVQAHRDSIRGAEPA